MRPPISVDRGANRLGKYVSAVLRAPATARFPSWRDAGDPTVRVIHYAPCRARVVSWVDAQNGFGAKLRTHYTIDMESPDGGETWHGGGLEMIQR